MPLHPQAEALLAQIAATNAPDTSELSVETAREMYEALISPEPGEPVQVEDRTLQGSGSAIPVRCYRPVAEGVLPALIYYHGGGWVIGSLDTHDHLCRALASAAGCAVIAVDYRLAPEHPFPAAVEDCYAAIVQLSERADEFNIDSRRLAVAGDSAGGNLAAVVAWLVRERRGPRLCCQVLIYPVTTRDPGLGSMVENGEGYLLTAKTMEWFWEAYLSGGGDGRQATASPLLIGDLSRLPPALVITAEFDPLRDEGEAYAERLAEAGVEVTQTRYEGAIHDFVRMSFAMDQGVAAIAEAATALRRAFS